MDVNMSMKNPVDAAESTQKIMKCVQDYGAYIDWTGENLVRLYTYVADLQNRVIVKHREAEIIIADRTRRFSGADDASEQAEEDIRYAKEIMAVCEKNSQLLRHMMEEITRLQPIIQSAKDSYETCKAVTKEITQSMQVMIEHYIQAK